MSCCMIKDFISPFQALRFRRCLESGLKLRYQESWKLILDVISKFFEVSFMECLGPVV